MIRDHFVIRNRKKTMYTMESIDGHNDEHKNSKVKNVISRTNLTTDFNSNGNILFCLSSNIWEPVKISLDWFNDVLDWFNDFDVCCCCCCCWTELSINIVVDSLGWFFISASLSFISKLTLCIFIHNTNVNTAVNKVKTSGSNIRKISIIYALSHL